MSDEDFDSVIDINLKGAFNCLRCAAKYMVKQRHGKIINISSIVGVTGNAGQANYSASKAGIIGLTKSAAKELAGRNINVNAVAPGFVITSMTDAIPDKIRNEYMEKIPLKRFGRPEDIAEAVGFLSCEESNYITGQVINIDGGMVM
jgi:3-oxoacyl-[acyl-carrier protein] reductase